MPPAEMTSETFAYLHKNLFNIKKDLPLVPKKNFPCSFLCIPNQFKESSHYFLYTTRINQKFTNDTMF